MDRHVHELNAETWRYRNIGEPEVFEVARYEGARRGHNDWHIDGDPQSSDVKRRLVRWILFLSLSCTHFLSSFLFVLVRMVLDLQSKQSAPLE